MAELSVKLTADVRRLLDALELTEDQLKRVTIFADEAGESTENLGNRAAPRAARGFQQIGKATANANPTLLEFNRVIQDAPFGIQGVANNITQLTQNFGTLSQQSGGAVAALRALGSAFAGPAGILFAVSAVTSLLVTFGDRLTGTTDKVKELKEELEKVNESFSAELGLNEAIAEGLELQGKSTAQINRDRITILKNQITSVQAILAQNEALLTSLRIQRENVTLWEGFVGLLETGVQNSLTTIRRDLTFLAGLAGVILERTAEETGLRETLAQFAGDTTKATEEEQAAINQNTRLLTQIQELRNSILETEQAITEQVQAQTRARQESLAIAAQGLQPITAGITGIETTSPLTTAFNDISAAQAQFLADLETFNQASSQILSQGFANTIAAISSNIGAAIATGGNVLGALGGGLLAGVGDIMQQLGKQALLIGKTMLAIKFSFKSPFGAIAAGAALIAAGALFKGAAGSVGQIGSGATTSGGSAGGFSGGIAPTASAGAGDGRVVFEIEGTKLVGVLSRTLTRNQRLGAGIIS